MFQDITTLLLDHKAFKHTIDIFVDRYKDMHISLVAGKPPLFVFFFLFLFSIVIIFYSIKKKINFLTCKCLYVNRS